MRSSGRREVRPHVFVLISVTGWDRSAFFNSKQLGLKLDALLFNCWKFLLNCISNTMVRGILPNFSWISCCILALRCTSSLFIFYFVRLISHFLSIYSCNWNNVITYCYFQSFWGFWFENSVMFLKAMIALFTESTC